jgi:AcrR family transcriptional regulator
MAGVRARAPARERLLDAAEELFYEGGIAATGVDAVLRRAHVAPATLYAHFAGKDHLVAAYLRRRHERWRATWDEVLQRCGDDPVERALSVFDALDEFHRQAETTRGCAFLAAAVEVTEPQHPAQQWLAADTELLADRLYALAAATGAADPGALATELFLLYDGALAARIRRAITTNGGQPTPLPPRALATAAIARHRDSGRKAGLLTRGQSAHDEQA